MNIELDPTKEDTVPPQLPRPDQTAQKALKIARGALILAVVGLGILGIMLFQAQSKISRLSGVGFKKELRNEITNSVSSSLQPQLQALSEKTAALEGKLLESKATTEKMAAFETRLSQFEVELKKNEQIRAKFAAMVAPKSKPKPMALKKPRNHLVPTSKKKK